MGYREEYREANEEVRERYGLVMERILKLRSEHSVEEKYWPYFRRLADIFVMVDETYVFSLHGASGGDSLGI